VAVVMACAGCNAMRWLSTPMWPEHEKIDVEAQYRGLEGKTVAVMVAANDHILFRYPTASIDVCRSISQRLVDNMDSVAVVDPQQVTAYQDNNPYWDRIPYGQLIAGMDVQRIVFVELDEYQTHDPGNAHVWQGLLAAHIGVIADDTVDPDDFVFYTSVSAQYPESDTVGIVNADAESIRLGMHTVFSRDAAGLFYDHEVIKPRQGVIGD
jgi:hypothetical protein